MSPFLTAHLLFKLLQSFFGISSTPKLPYVHEMMKDNPAGNPMDSVVLPIIDYAVTLDNGGHCFFLTLSAPDSSSKNWGLFLQRLAVES